MKISYDRIADVLYITFSKPQERAAFAFVEVNGGVLRIDESTREVIGITIPFFQEKADVGLELPEIGAVPFTPSTEETITRARSRNHQSGAFGV